MSVSLWQRGGRADAGAGLGHADVVVVGAGIAGVSAAIALERAGADVLVLESRALAAGASGRNAGYLIRGAADNYAAGVRAWGRERARTLWRWTEGNLRALLEEGVGELPSFRRLPSCIIATEEREERELRESAVLLAEDGFDASVIEAGAGPDDAVWRSGRARLGLVNPGDAVCDPVELVSHLRAQLTRARIVQGVEVGAIGAAGSGVRVETSGGAVTGGRVLVCTNAWAGTLIEALRDVVKPNRGQMLAFHPPRAADADLAFAYYLDHGSEYLRPGPGGQVVLGGGRKHAELAERGFGEQTTPGVQAWLERYAEGLFGSPLRVTARWAGTMGFSPDGVPLVGPVGVEGVEEGRVWVCAGFTGHGMSLAFTTARAAVGEMLGGERTPFGVDRLG
ncbi:MAG: FAD-binding oxidoreductase [Phycisphaerales bacterium]